MTREQSLEQQVAEAGPEAVKLYKQIRENGETAEWAAMCALRQAPGARYTARAYEQGFHDNMGSMSEMTRQGMLLAAKKAGVNTAGKFYNGTGAYGEQTSWSTCAEDVLTAAKKKNLTLTGALKHQGRPCDKPVERKRLADDIAQRFIRQELAANPALKEKAKKNRKVLREVYEKVVEKHGAKKK